MAKKMFFVLVFGLSDFGKLSSLSGIPVLVDCRLHRSCVRWPLAVWIDGGIFSISFGMRPGQEMKLPFCAAKMRVDFAGLKHPLEAPENRMLRSGRVPLKKTRPNHFHTHPAANLLEVSFDRRSRPLAWTLRTCYVCAEFFALIF